MLKYLIDGGLLMIPIVVCSVVALAAFLERAWSLRRGAVVPAAFTRKLTSLISQGKVEDAASICAKHDVAVARVVAVALDEREAPRAHIKERLEDVGRREAAELERFIPVLGTVASIAPLLGLLGTVGGMIMTFEAIEVKGLGNVGNLAGGISVALITTFAGLCVGIPALVANRFLLSRVDRLLLELEEASQRVLELLTTSRDEA